LIYFNARYYDPLTGRFLTEDPSRQGVNWYAYCGDNPINRVDMNGKDYGDVGNQYGVSASQAINPPGQQHGGAGEANRTAADVQRDIARMKAQYEAWRATVVPPPYVPKPEAQGSAAGVNRSAEAECQKALDQAAEKGYRPDYATGSERDRSWERPIDIRNEARKKVLTQDWKIVVAPLLDAYTVVIDLAEKSPRIAEDVSNFFMDYLEAMDQKLP
jgi:uncharacterized protein RhaS with RHS repeats